MMVTNGKSLPLQTVPTYKDFAPPPRQWLPGYDNDMSLEARARALAQSDDEFDSILRTVQREHERGTKDRKATDLRLADWEDWRLNPRDPQRIRDPHLELIDYRQEALKYWQVLYRDILFGKDGHFDASGYLALTHLREIHLGDGSSETQEWGASTSSELRQYLDGWSTMDEYDNLIYLVESSHNKLSQSIETDRVIKDGTYNQALRFTKDDLPYLYSLWRQACKEDIWLRARIDALPIVIDDFEVGYTFLSVHRESERKIVTTSRGVDYFRAIAAIKGEAFPNLSKFFEAVANNSPKRDGSTPSMNAPREWMKANGWIKDGDTLDDFRSELEAEAERLARLDDSQHSGPLS